MSTTATTHDPRAQRIADAKATADILAEVEQSHSRLAYKILQADPTKNWGDCQKQAAQDMIAAGDKTQGFPDAARTFLVRFAPDSAAAPAPSSDPIAEAAAEADATTAA